MRARRKPLGFHVQTWHLYPSNNPNAETWGSSGPGVVAHSARQVLRILAKLPAGVRADVRPLLGPCL